MAFVGLTDTLFLRHHGGTMLMLSIFGSRKPTATPIPEPVERVEQVDLAEQTEQVEQLEQVNALASADSDFDSAAAAIANPAKMSITTAAKLTPIGPRLVVQSKYVVAVRASDGTVLSRGVAAMPADVIELYGTGFGSTTASVNAGVDSTGECSTGKEVTVSIGGAPADVRFAGRVGPGLYQINVTVPADLPGGDHSVVASVAGMGTQANALLKIAKAADRSPEPAGRYSCFVRIAMEEAAVR
jgi:uncharacterized protein (TIGR03437 family)